MSKEQLYQDQFKGRKDCIGKLTNGKPNCYDIENEEALLSLISDHLSGKSRLGLYNKFDDNRVGWEIVEFEDQGNQKAKEPLSWALEYQRLLNKAGIKSYIERSKNRGGNCYHLWIFFAERIDSGEIHDVLSGLAKHIDEGFNHEVFPKSGNVNLGQFVWLPLFGGRDEAGSGVAGERTVFVDESGKAFDSDNARRCFLVVMADRRSRR
jgi:hypothetical protein